jgi:hypothetical protein
MRWVALLLLAAMLAVAGSVATSASSSDVPRPVPMVLCPPAC